MAEYIGRNDPCPCGSGKKYKNCCAGKRRFTDRSIAGVKVWVLLVGAGLAFAIVVGVSFTQGPDPASVVSGGAPNPSTAGPPGQPWQYDSLTNRHYDPTHGHWHDGPPPPQAQQSEAATGREVSQENPGGITPQPYAYDSVGNRYYDPGHGHWHAGPPPAGVR